MEVKSGEPMANSERLYSSISGSRGSSGSGDSYPKYKGVRLRKWGKWVSEIRLPNSRERIWLGSYDTAEKAARAFDAAQFCLRGCHVHFNFPQSPPDIPCGRSLSQQEIQVVAARFAEQEQDQQHDKDEHAGQSTANHHHYNSSQEPNPNFPSVMSDQEYCYGSHNYMSSTTSYDMTNNNNNNMDYWSFLNCLDFSTHDGANISGNYDHNFDQYDYSLFSGQLDKMHSDSGDYFCGDDSVPPAFAAPDDSFTRSVDDNILNGDELIVSHHSSSFLWNF